MFQARVKHLEQDEKCSRFFFKKVCKEKGVFGVCMMKKVGNVRKRMCWNEGLNFMNDCMRECVFMSQILE